MPGMLFAAGHVKNDVPSVLNAYAAEHGLKIEYGRDLGLDPRLLARGARPDRRGAGGDDDAGRPGRHAARGDRPRHLGPGRQRQRRQGRAHALGGHGLRLGRGRLQRGRHPQVDALLERASRLGFRRIVVFPYFLFTGVLVRRIYAQTDAVAARHPEIEFMKAGYLGDHPRF